MVHKRIVGPVLERLSKENAVYFADIVHRLDDDPRTEKAPNIVYLVLKETIPLLPPYLPKNQFLDMLYEFVETNFRTLNRAIYDPKFVRSSDDLKKITNGFVTQVLDAVMELYQKGEIESGERKAKRFAWPFTDTDFPFDE